MVTYLKPFLDKVAVNNVNLFFFIVIEITFYKRCMIYDPHKNLFKV